MIRPKLKENENGIAPKREFRVSKIQIVVFADLIENGRKLDEVVIGPEGNSNGTQPYTLYDIDAVREWCDAFPKIIDEL